MRLIDADSLIVAFEPDHDCDWYTPWIIEKINEAPTVEAVPVVRGEWIFKFDGVNGSRRAYCSACKKRSGIGGIVSNQRKPFCPNCGADMRGEK